MNTPKASVIILVWNGKAYLEDCLSSVLDQAYADFELIVVDNGSSDGSAEFVAERFAQVQLIRNERNVGFAAGNNVGLRAARGDKLVLLNQDTVVQAGWLAALVDALGDPGVGLVGCKLLYPDGSIQHAGARLCDVRASPEHVGRHEADGGQYDQPRDVDFVTGACLALSRSTLARLGMLDEDFAPAYFEDVDWCYRARQAGLRVVYWPAARVTHYESTTVDVDSYAHKAVYHHGRLRLLFKHKPLSWLQQEFAPAELDWATRLGRTVEMMAVRNAYVRLLLSLPGILTFRLQPTSVAYGQAPHAEWEGLLALAAALRQACAHDEPQAELYAQLDHIQAHAPGTRILEAAQARSPAVDASQAQAPGQPTPLDEQLAALHAGWKIQERPFRSELPIVGGGVAAFRQAWNDVATRWYVLPILQQQNAFNSGVTQLVTGLAGRQAELAGQQAEVAVTQIAVLNILRQMLDKLEGQRRDIAQSVREIDQLALELIRLRQHMAHLEKPEEEERRPPGSA